MGVAQPSPRLGAEGQPALSPPATLPAPTVLSQAPSQELSLEPWVSGAAAAEACLLTDRD